MPVTHGGRGGGSSLGGAAAAVPAKPQGGRARETLGAAAMAVNTHGGRSKPWKKLRAAVVLHGKLGGIDRGQGWTRAVDGGAPTIDLPVICYASLHRHIIRSNPDYAIDIFGHSWSPELGPALDAIYSPRVSLYQAEERMRNRQLCGQTGQKLRQITQTGTSGVAVFGGFGGVGRGANSCERTASHMLGMQRAIQLKARFEAAHGFKYDLVLVSRWDVLWARPLELRRVDVSSNAFTVPNFCTHARGIDHRSPLERNLTAFRKAICGGPAGPGQIPTASTLCHPSHRPCAGDLSKRARELYLLDWWFLSSSRMADDFGEVGGALLFQNYTIQNQLHLASPRSSHATIMGHAYWGMHIVWGLQAQLRYTGHVGIDFSLGRVLTRSGCRGLKERCAGDECTADDAIARPWHVRPLPPMPPRPALEFTFGAAQTRTSCSEGQFYCEGRSQMCQEEATTWEPMDRSKSRHLWLSCTKDICQRAAADRYSTRCAGAYLAGYTAVWRHMRPAVANVSLSLKAAGAFDGGALAHNEPAHEALALNSLSKLAQELYSTGRAAISVDAMAPTNAERARGALHALVASCGTAAREYSEANKRWER